MAEVGGVVERVPVAYLDRGGADRHGVLLIDAGSLRKCRAKRGPDIGGAVASVDRAAFVYA